MEYFQGAAKKSQSKNQMFSGILSENKKAAQFIRDGIKFIIYLVMVLYRLSKTCYFEFFVVLPHPFSYYITLIPCDLILDIILNLYYFHSFDLITSHLFFM